MKETLRRSLVLSLSVLLVLGLIVGCAGTPAVTTPGATDKTTAAVSTTPAATTTAAVGAEKITLPLFPAVTELSIFWRLNPKATASMKNYSEMRLVQELEKRTNVRLKFVQPPIGQDQEQFNLMRASNNYSDIIYWETWLAPTTVGGPEKAIADKFILPLNDLMAQYSPNLTALMAKEPKIKRDIATDNGTLYGYPLLRYNQSMKGVWGFLIREDWLKKLGLKMPTTVAEYHDVLVAFRDKDPNGNGQKDEIPFTGPKGRYLNLLYMWGITNDFMNVDGKVVYGPFTEEYRQAMTTLSKWYAEGLIDKDFAVNDERQAEAKLLADKGGSYWGETGGSTGLIMKSFTDSGATDKRIVGFPIPKLKTGDVNTNYNMDRLYDGVAASISSTNKYPIQSAKLLDYAYSDEGSLLYNFGIEGESYTMVDGKPKFMDMITKNPNGLSIDQALARYCFGSMQANMVFSPMVRDQRMLFFDWQGASIAEWNKDSNARKMPPVTMTIEENKSYAKIMADIQTYMDENFNKFLQGITPMSDFDKYLAQLKAMGIEQAIAFRQSALDRYNARK